MYPWKTSEKELEETLQYDYNILHLLIMNASILDEKYINMLWRMVERIEDYGKIKYNVDLEQHIKDVLNGKGD